MKRRSAPSAEPAPPRRAKLELLVRKPDAEGETFEVRQVGSAVAFLQLRPQRVDTDSYELADVASRVSGDHSFILKNRVTERYLLLSEPERFLWEQMDGHTSLQDLATAYVLRYGEFNFEIIPTLIRKLQRAQLLVLTPASRLRKALARNRASHLVKMMENALLVLERVNISSRRVNGFFYRLYRFGGFLFFTRVAAALCVLLAVAGVVAGVRLWNSAEQVAAGLGANPLLALLGVKLLFLFTVAAHQLVHGLALVHYGRRVREFGFTFLHGFVPTFYVDVTDVFMTSQRARVVTAVSGALVHLVLGSLWLLVAVQSPVGFLQGFAAASGMIQWQAFVIALYPFCFIEMDGYHVLVDVLGVPTLKSDALGYVGAFMRGRASWPDTREEWLWVGYVGLSALSIAGFAAFNVWLVVHAT
jgi:putative peptide zinc metalloprotease protein